MSGLSIRYNDVDPPWVIEDAGGVALAATLLRGHHRGLVLAADVVAAGVTGPHGSALADMLDELRDEEDGTMVLAEWLSETQKAPAPSARRLAEGQDRGPPPGRRKR